MNIIPIEKMCFGTMTFGCKGIFDKIGMSDYSEAESMIRYVYERGITRFDTASGYSDGESEKMLGRAISAISSEVSISTKVCRSLSTTNSIDLSYKNIIKSCERSLYNLGVDNVSTLYLHDFDKDTTLTESIDALEHLCDRQLIDNYGVCNYNYTQLKNIIEIGSERLRYVQYRYSLLENNFTSEIRKLVNRHNINFVAYSLLAGGILTGKYLISPDNENFRLNRLGVNKISHNSYQVEEIKKMADKLNTSIEYLAINHVIQDVDYGIFGARNLFQVKSLMRAIGHE
ncbi:aldo/keto reductase [Vibrio mimicus]